MKKRHTIPTIIGLIIVIIAIGFGVFATQYRTIFRIGATGEFAPQGVRITNVTDTSFTVSWITTRPSTGAVEWGQTQGLGQTSLDDLSELVEGHSVTVKNLSANTVYYFKIRSGGELFDNNGLVWQISTGSTVSQSSNTTVLSGTVVSPENQPVANALVYITSSVSSPLSVRTSANGSWVLPLGTARNSDNSATASFTSNTPITIFVQGGNQGIATAESTITTSSPTPTITLGQTLDFRNDEPVTETENPNNNSPEDLLNLPTEGDEESTSGGFNLENETTTPDTASVTLESVDNGELVTSTRPQFFGEGPAGEQITIIVQSDPITGQVTVPQSGNWQWTPPSSLPPGEHTVTLRWTDAQGILRTLVRSFVVSAADGPAFETTPSGGIATPRPLTTLAPTSSPRPTASASASPTIRPTSSPRVSIPATDSGTPVAGSLTPTLALSIMGIALVIISAVLVSKSL